MKTKIYKLLASAKQGLFVCALTVFLGSAYSQTFTLSYTGGPQTLIIPVAGIWGIECWGADGGDVTAGPGGGGKGGYAKGAYTILTAGTVINIFVGGKGTTASGSGSPGGAGGWNGGGGGGYCGKSGGGGGGATDVRIGGTAATDRKIVAGGGGGAAYYNLMCVGGNGGAQVAQNGDFITSGNVLTVGTGGAGANGGTPGICIPALPTSDGTTTGGGGGGNSPGGFGQPGIGGGAGGAGGTLANGATGSSGGGGGGYAGGAGGGQGPVNAGAGGGGGSGYIGGVSNGLTVQNGQTGFVANPDLLGNGKVIITRLCNISLNASQNPICIGASITLTTDAVSGITWGNSSSTGNSILVTPVVGTTNYSVTGTSTANCQTTAVLAVTVHPLPVISSVVSPTTLCVGGTATINATGAYSYTWSTGLSGSTTTMSPGVTTTFSVTATSVYGCINSNTISVPVNTNFLVVSSGSPVCMGTAVMLMASGAVTYTWSTGSMFAAVPVSPTVLTNYVVSGTDAYGCVLSNVIALSPSPLPDVSISLSKSIICKGESVVLTALGATSFTWNDGTVGSSLNRTLPVDVPYYYSVTGTDASGCSKTVSITVAVAKCLGVSEIEGSSLDLMVIPNPGSGLFNLQVNSQKVDLYMNVYNTLGMLIKTAPVVTGPNQLDLRAEKAGIYFIYVNNKDDNTTQVIKLINE